MKGGPKGWAQARVVRLHSKGELSRDVASDSLNWADGLGFRVEFRVWGGDARAGRCKECEEIVRAGSDARLSSIRYPSRCFFCGGALLES